MLKKPDRIDHDDYHIPRFSYYVADSDSKIRFAFDLENELIKKSTINLSSIKLRLQIHNSTIY